MIRPLQLSDAQSVAALHAASFDHGWSVEDMWGHIQNDLALGFFENHVLQGFILLRVVDAQADILTIAVSKSCRGKGYGALLLEASETELKMKGVDVIFLEVAENNHAAIALYKRCGFYSIGRRPGYYRQAGGRVAALSLSKRL